MVDYAGVIPGFSPDRMIPLFLAFALSSIKTRANLGPPHCKCNGVLSKISNSQIWSNGALSQRQKLTYFDSVVQGIPLWECLSCLAYWWTARVARQMTAYHFALIQDRFCHRSMYGFINFSFSSLITQGGT